MYLWWDLLSVLASLCPRLQCGPPGSGARPARGVCHLSVQTTAGKLLQRRDPRGALVTSSVPAAPRRLAARRSVHRRSAQAAGTTDLRLTASQHRAAWPQSRRNYVRDHLPSPLPALRAPSTITIQDVQHFERILADYPPPLFSH